MRALVLELVEGATLADRIAQGPIPLDEALRIAQQIAEALELAHERGVIHRDLKPANIKLTASDDVKVLDFGLAKALSRDSAAGDVSNSPMMTALATHAGVIIGTATYMSAEQARGKVADKRSDIWAFGCVLYEMLTGQRAFEGQTISDTLASVLKTDPNGNALPSDVPLAVRRLLRRCFQKDPKRRLQAIGDARIEIEEFLSGTADDTVGPGPGAGPPLQRVLPWALVGLATVVALGVSVLHLRDRREPRRADMTVRFTVFPPPGATRTAGGRGTFAVSPDGQTLAFEAKDAASVPHLFIRRLDAAEAQLIAQTSNASRPFWSPDSRSVGFFNDGGLYRADLDGSPPRRLCDVPRGVFLGGTWGTRGVIVFASSGVGLLRVPETAGTVTTPVTTLDGTAGEVSHTSPQFLPDGRHVLFLVLTDEKAEGVIWAVSIDESTRTRIGESSGGATYVNGWLLYTTGGASRDLVARRFDVPRLALDGDRSR